MAFRPHAQVVRGEIDNRTRGCVAARIWFLGREDPVVLELEGNAWRDLAGRRLEFVNRNPEPGDVSTLRARQVGPIGDCTASRKVKVPDISHDEIAEYYRARKPFPWHWANSLYLEWFSTENGRVVIESADFELKIADGPTWEMSEAEELDQRRANAAALGDFMRRLGDAFALTEAGVDAPGNVQSGADEEPVSEEEADAERLYADNERLLDRIEARMDREGEDADFEAILEEEIERMRAERGEAADSGAESFDPNGDEDDWEDVFPDDETAAGDHLERKHPLAARAFEFVLWLEDELTPPDGARPELPHEHPVSEMRRCSMIAAAKLAGALNGKPWPLPRVLRANSLVRLKRAREHFADARVAVADCPPDSLPPSKKLTEIAARLDAFIAECDRLIVELRRDLQDE